MTVAAHALAYQHDGHSGYPSVDYLRGRDAPCRVWESDAELTEPLCTMKMG